MRKHPVLTLAGLLALLALVYLFNYPASEPFFNNDETRHAMTGVFFRDLLHDAPLARLRDYTVGYYLQYPALGLLVWPPFFYFVEGVAMSLFGTSLIVGKALVWLYLAIACAYLFFLVRRTHGEFAAAVTVPVFALAPLVFKLSHYVMLEVPTLAAGLAATFYFTRYLDADRRRDLFAAALASALALLTRFDAVYLVPLFLILLVARKRLSLLRRAEVWLAAVGALLLVLPFYALTASQIGWFHLRNVSEQMDSSHPAYLSVARLLYYPACVPTQLGPLALIAALAGLVYALGRERRSRAWPYLATVLACYVTFTPMAETESRHTVYWVPAFALFAAEGVALLGRALPAARARVAVAALLLCGMVGGAARAQLPFVRGYEEAARYVVGRTGDSPFCLFVGRLNGNFIYQARRSDPSRGLWVLRADKLLYSVLVNSEFGYKQHAATDEETLALIHRYDPAYLVVEEGNPFGLFPAEERVRKLIAAHPERFALEQTFAVVSGDPEGQAARLLVYRNQHRNTQAERRLNIELLMLRRSFETSVP